MIEATMNTKTDLRDLHARFPHLCGILDRALCSAYLAGQASAATSPDHPASYDHDAHNRAASDEAMLWEELSELLGRLP